MTASKPHVFLCDGLEIREREYCIVREGEAFPVEPRAFRVLIYLLSNPQRLITKEELLQSVWGDVAVTENSLARAILKLRQTLGDDARSPRYIETVSRIGYRFVGSVAVQADRESSEIKDQAFAVYEENRNGTPEKAADHAPVSELAYPPSAINGTISGDSPVSQSTSRTTLRWLLATGAALILILGGEFWYLSRPLPPPRITAYTQLTHDGREKTLGGTDGSRLYFTQNSPNLIAQISVNGGDVAQIALPVPAAQMQLMDISPDGSSALVGTLEAGHNANPQWIVPILGGGAKRLEDGEGEAFSPDGGSVIYSTLSGEIFMVHTDGSEKHKLADVGSVAYGFKWSPDGKVIRFSKGDGLWEMSADGKGVHRLLPGWKEGVPCCGIWTRDGVFLFQVNGQIWALDERHILFRRPSSDPLQLTSGPIAWGAPIPGKDGKRIFDDGAKLRGELTRIDVKTGSPQPFLGGISAEFVSFSPDGNSVAYVTYPEGILWQANRDGSNRVELTTSASFHVLNPRWSPDAKQILFTSIRPDGHVSIHRISSADGSPQWLLPDQAEDVTDPNWSPDGKKVLFALGPGNSISALRHDLRMVDLETRQVTILPGSAGMWSPRWSSDGRYIMALPATEATSLSVLDFTTRQWHTVPVNGDTEFPAFSHDCSYIYFLRFGRGQGVFRVPVTGGKEERIVDMANWHITGIFNFSMTLDPTDAPLVLRDTGTDDIYALTLEEK